MRAAVLRHPKRPTGGRRLDVGAVADPTPRADEVLIEIATCGVCRTDLQLADGDLPARRLPIIPGHQIVGRVIAHGSNVDGVRDGDRVGVAWLATACGSCRFCLGGRENLCVDSTFTGWDRDGGFAQLVTAHHRFVYRLPESISDIDAAPLLCAGAIGARSLGATALQRGRLGLFGFGASATYVAQLALRLGCEVFVVTRGVHEQERARALGATWAGSYEDAIPVALDAAITFAPVGDVVIRALRAVDRGGTVVVNAIHLDRIPEFPYDDLWWERSIRSVANVTRADVESIIASAETEPFMHDLLEFPLDHVNEALDALATGSLRGAAVLAIS